MGLRVSPESLAREWSLSFADIDFVNAKPAGSRLGLAVQLKFFAAFGYFATAAAEVPGESVSYLADQLGGIAGKVGIGIGHHRLECRGDGQLVGGCG